MNKQHLKQVEHFYLYVMEQNKGIKALEQKAEVEVSNWRLGKLNWIQSRFITMRTD